MKKLLITIILFSSFSIFAMEEKERKEEKLNTPFTEIVINYYLKHFWEDATRVDEPIVVEIMSEGNCIGNALFDGIYYPIKTETKDGIYAFSRVKKYFRREGSSTESKDNLVEYVVLAVYARKNVFGKSNSNSEKDLPDMDEDLFEQIVAKAHKSKKLRDKESELLNKNIDASTYYTLGLDKWTKVTHSSERHNGESVLRLETSLPKESYLDIRSKIVG